ncbi:MAG: transposase [Deltaproteobacteria bacterium]|nr:transposase [Deltaproteobacteria bacterium]
MFETEEQETLSIATPMRKTRKTYDGLFKARIVCEWINGKRSLKELAEFYNVHPNQIKNWKSTLLKNANFVLNDRRKTAERRLEQMVLPSL